MANLPGTNREILTQKAYATDRALAIRQRTHEQYSVPQINFAEWVLSRTEWHGDECVLDIGTGSGSYFDAIRERIPNGRLIAGDLSFGMVRKARQKHRLDEILNTDVQALPFPRRTFDLVLANHMLYHVPDLNAALSEIHRVLKPTGTLVAATNSQYNLPELEQIIRRTYSLLGARNTEVELLRPYQFYLEDASIKAGRHFFAVARYDLPGALVFPSAQPVIDYVDSMRYLREARLPPNITWEDFITVFGDQLRRIIAHYGELVVSKLAGLIVASDAGGFVNDYVSRFIILRRGRP
jgi:SAM-dependent methyltransferase